MIKFPEVIFLAKYLLSMDVNVYEGSNLTQHYLAALSRVAESIATIVKIHFFFLR